MAFNPLMIRLTAEILAKLPAAPSVVELGNQTFRPAGGIVAEVAAYLRNERPGWDGSKLLEIARRSGSALDGSSADYMSAIGYGTYSCIDVNDRYSALQMDLNYALSEKYGFREEFDLVTNNGTGEHVFDQASAFKNIHALTRVNGLMLHVLPFHNYTNHGFYNFQPVLFHDLSYANNYRIMRISLANSDGAEVAFVGGEQLRTTRDVKRFPQEAALERTIAWPGLLELKSRTLKRGTRPLAKAIRSLSIGRANVLVVAVLQKTVAGEFCYPMQGMYSGGNISSESIAEAYSGNAKVS